MQNKSRGRGWPLLRVAASSNPTLNRTRTGGPSHRAFWRAPVSSALGCAVLRHGFSVGASPIRQLSLRPVATGAVVEVTKRLKPLV